MVKIFQCSKELLEKDMTGKTIVITGGYCGIGAYVSKALCSQGATVVIAGRSAEKGEAFANKIGATFMELDLRSQESTKKFVTAFLQKYEKLDTLVCNAAIMAAGAPDTKNKPDTARTIEGYEAHLAVNYLNHVLLIHSLEKVIRSTPKSRILHISSCCAESMPMAGMKEQASVDLEDPHWKKRDYDEWQVYGASKLAQFYHTKELAKKWPEVTVVALHPGWAANSALDRHSPWALRNFLLPYILGPIFRLAGNGPISTADGSQVHLHCILSDTKDLESGKFYSQWRLR